MFENLKSAIKNNFKPKNQKHYEPEKISRGENTSIESDIIISSQDSETNSSLPNFKTLKNYEIKSTMGDGAYSIVYQATYKPKSENVAIKTISKIGLKRDVHIGIQKEVALLKRCNHKNIIKLKDLVQDRSNYFIITELCTGGEIFAKIVELGSFSEPLARHVFVNVARGISYLHKTCGIVHRDIKPENILFNPIPIINKCEEFISRGCNVYNGNEEEGYIVEGLGGGGIGEVKIADFGLSKIVWENSTQTPCGTVGYAAPEIINDKGYSLTVDIWALGCVLYTMLCGFPPFYDEDVDILTEKVANGKFEFLSPWWDNISDSSKDLVSKLLKREPDDRFDIGECLSHKWTNDISLKISNVDDMIKKFINTRIAATPMTPNVTLKEAFDISYAAHRLENEMKGKAANVLGNISELAKFNEVAGFNANNSIDLNIGSSALLAKRKNENVLA